MYETPSPDGGPPKNRRYSRLNCDSLSYPTSCATAFTLPPAWSIWRAVIGAFTTPLLKAGAGAGPADLVNISSIAARNIFPYFAVYSGTKAFVTHLSTHLRAELGAKGVRVTAIEPGIVGTELANHVDFQGAIDWLEGSKSQIEWLKSEDVAEAITFTVSLPKRVNLQQVTIMPTAQPS